MGVEGIGWDLNGRVSQYSSFSGTAQFSCSQAMITTCPHVLWNKVTRCSDMSPDMREAEAELYNICRARWIYLHCAKRARDIVLGAGEHCLTAAIVCIICKSLASLFRPKVQHIAPKLPGIVCLSIHIFNI